jgi:hypothetical protein
MVKRRRKREKALPHLVQVPALASAGLEAPFELRLLCGVPLELVPLPELRSVVMQVRGRVAYRGTAGPWGYVPPH